MAKKKKGYRLQWHPAFYAGLQIELGKDAGNLIFENEHQLSTKPLGIDVLVIKKDADIPIHKNIGRIFRKYNLVEYKSPSPYRWQLFRHAAHRYVSDNERREPVALESV